MVQRIKIQCTLEQAHLRPQHNLISQRQLHHNTQDNPKQPSQTSGLRHLQKTKAFKQGDVQSQAVKQSNWSTDAFRESKKSPQAASEWLHLIQGRQQRPAKDTFRLPLFKWHRARFTDTQTSMLPGKNQGAQCAFKILMIHEILQFALRIAFRCVLHRCGNLDIHC